MKLERKQPAGQRKAGENIIDQHTGLTADHTGLRSKHTGLAPGAYGFEHRAAEMASPVGPSNH